MTQSDLILIYVPCGTEDEATALANALIEKGLIACANIHASRSLYRWEGSLVDEEEQILLCKTTQSSADPAEALIKEMHSYELPCILRLRPDHVNPEYAAWVVGETSTVTA